MNPSICGVWFFIVEVFFQAHDLKPRMFARTSLLEE